MACIGGPVQAKNGSALAFAYGAGDAGFNLFWVLLDGFLLYFLVEVRHLQASMLSPVLLLGRGVDLAGGLLCGLFADRVRTSVGSYRPFLLISALPLWAVFALLFSRRAGTNLGLLLSSYALFSLIYASANVAYTALLSVISDSEAERTRLSTARFVAAAVAVLVVQACTLPLVSRLSRVGGAEGWQRVATLYGGCGALLLLLCFAGLRERALPRPQTGANVVNSIRAILRAPGFARLLLAMVASLAALGCRGAVTPFYVRHSVMHPEWISGALVANSLAALLACVVVPKMVKPDARQLAERCALAGLTLCLPPLLLPIGSHAGLLVEQVMFGGATGMLLPSLFALFAEYPNRLGGRHEATAGLVAAASLTSLKLGAMAGSVIVSGALGWLHFVAAGAEPAGVITWIGELFTVVPAVLFGLTWWAVPGKRLD